MIRPWSLFFLSLVLLIPLAAHAQFELSGQIRPRSEYRHGYKTLAEKEQDPAFFIQQRSRLNLAYESDRFRTGIVFQDIRVWGDQPQLNVSDGRSSIHEAWGELLLGENFSIKLGRQELAYDDHRILGSVNWAQQARSHDVALLKFEDSTYKAHAGAAFNQGSPTLYNTRYNVRGNYKAMQFLWLNRTKGPWNSSILFLNNGMPYETTDSNGLSSQNIVYSQTLGGRIAYGKGKGFGASGAFYYQFGKDALQRELNAYYAMGRVSWKGSSGLSVKLGYEHLSGTSQLDPPTDANRSFTPFYGTNHKFNGFMDHFYVGNHVNGVGLMNPYLKFGFKKKGFSIGLHGHYFRSAAKVTDGEHFAKTGERQAMDPYLGSEADLVLGYKLSKNATVKAGYSQFFPTNTLWMLEGGSTTPLQNWGWLMVNITPQFLKG